MNFQLHVAVSVLLSVTHTVLADENDAVRKLIAKPRLFKSITNPSCSYCNVQHKKGLINDNDRVVAWLRSNHNGGAIPLRHFLSATRVINDTCRYLARSLRPLVTLRPCHA